MYNTLSLYDYINMIKFMLLCTLIINIFPVNDSLNQSQDRQVPGNEK